MKLINYLYHYLVDGQEEHTNLKLKIDLLPPLGKITFFLLIYNISIYTQVVVVDFQIYTQVVVVDRLLF